MPSVAEVKAAFDIFDANGDGYLSAAELKAILTRPFGNRPPKFTDVQAEEFLKRFDTNGDGVLSIEEFTTAFASLAKDKDALAHMMELVAAPLSETFEDLVPKGAGCTIDKTEHRGVLVAQLRAVVKHIRRRCGREGWLGGYPEKKPIEPGQVTLYETCGHVIKVPPAWPTLPTAGAPHARLTRQNTTSLSMLHLTYSIFIYIISLCVLR